MTEQTPGKNTPAEGVLAELAAAYSQSWELLTDPAQAEAHFRLGHRVKELCDKAESLGVSTLDLKRVYFSSMDTQERRQNIFDDMKAHDGLDLTYAETGILMQEFGLKG
jgi:hypothetical protein